MRDLIYIFIGDWILERLRRVYDWFSDYRISHPRLGKLGMVLTCIAVVAVPVVGILLLMTEAWTSEAAIVKWAAAVGVVAALAALIFVLLRRLIRWRKKCKQTEYDPRYQK